EHPPGVRLVPTVRETHLAHPYRGPDTRLPDPVVEYGARGRAGLPGLSPSLGGVPRLFHQGNDYRTVPGRLRRRHPRAQELAGHSGNPPGCAHGRGDRHPGLLHLPDARHLDPRPVAGSQHPIRACDVHFRRRSRDRAQGRQAEPGTPHPGAAAMTGPAAGFLAGSVTLAMALLVAALFAALLRLLKGPTLPDRVLALDLITSLVVGIIAVRSISTGQTALLRVCVAIALLAFLGTAAWAQYIKKESES